MCHPSSMAPTPTPHTHGVYNMHPSTTVLLASRVVTWWQPAHAKGIRWCQGTSREESIVPKSFSPHCVHPIPHMTEAKGHCGYPTNIICIVVIRLESRGCLQKHSVNSPNHDKGCALCGQNRWALICSLNNLNEVISAEVGRTRYPFYI